MSSLPARSFAPQSGAAWQDTSRRNSIASPSSGRQRNGQVAGDEALRVLQGAVDQLARCSRAGSSTSSSSSASNVEQLVHLLGVARVCLDQVEVSAVPHSKRSQHLRSASSANLSRAAASHDASSSRQSVLCWPHIEAFNAEYVSLLPSNLASSSVRSQSPPQPFAIGVDVIRENVTQMVLRTDDRTGPVRLSALTPLHRSVWDYFRGMFAFDREEDADHSLHPFALTISHFTHAMENTLRSVFVKFARAMSCKTDVVDSLATEDTQDEDLDVEPLLDIDANGADASDPLFSFQLANPKQRQVWLRSQLTSRLQQEESSIRAFVASHSAFTWSVCSLSECLRDGSSRLHTRVASAVANLSKSLCEQCIESVVLSSLPSLARCYSLITMEEDVQLNGALEHFADCTPAMVGVPQSLRLTKSFSAKYERRLSVDSQDSAANLRGIATSSANAEPYGQAIAVLRRMEAAPSWHRKVDLLVIACQSITQAVSEHYDNMIDSSEVMIRSDELISLLAYCVLRARIPDIASHVHYMMQWIVANDMMGEQGYCLTTLRCVLDYVKQLVGAEEQANPSSGDAETKSMVSLVRHVSPSSLLSAASGAASTSAGKSHAADCFGQAGQFVRPDATSTDSAPTTSPTSPVLSSIAGGFGAMASPTPVVAVVAGQAVHAPTLASRGRSQAGGIFVRLADEAVDQLCAVAHDEEWQFSSKTDNISIFSRPWKSMAHLSSGGPLSPMSIASPYGSIRPHYKEESGVQCVKGEGLIKARPEEVARILREVVNRPHYDPTCVDARVVQRINKDTLIAHMSFRGRRWCTTAYRDFCVLVHSRKLPKDGCEVIVGRSVRHKQCPPDAQGKFLRGRILFSGWLLKPIRLSADSDVITDCTYVVQVDVGGVSPTWFKNFISAKQPLLIQHLREFFSLGGSAESILDL